MNENYKPRFSFEIDEELSMRVNKVITNYGMRKALFTPILEEVVEMIEQHGQIVVGIILDSAVRKRTIIPSLCKANNLIKGISNGNDRGSTN